MLSLVCPLNFQIQTSQTETIEIKQLKKFFYTTILPSYDLRNFCPKTEEPR